MRKQYLPETKNVRTYKLEKIFTNDHLKIVIFDQPKQYTKEIPKYVWEI